MQPLQILAGFRTVRCIGWNAHGLAFGEIEEFIVNSSAELSWDIMCLQEMSAVGCRDLTSGHKVYSTPREEEQKSLGFIISAAYTAFVVIKGELVSWTCV